MMATISPPGSPVAVGLGPNSCADGGGTYVANETSGTVSLIYDKTVHDTYVTGPQPSMLTGDGRVIIGNAGSGSVSVVGIVSGVRQIVATIPTGVDPSAALVDVKAEAMYVVNRGSDTVSVIDLHDYTVKQQVPLGTAPQGIVRHAENLFAANSGDGSVSVYKRFDFRHFYDDERLVWHNATTKQIAAWQMQGIAAGSLLRRIVSKLAWSASTKSRSSRAGAAPDPGHAGNGCRRHRADDRSVSRTRG